MNEQANKSPDFSGKKIGQVPVEVLEQFGNVMRRMFDVVEAHVKDPVHNPISDDFRESFISMAQTGGILVDKMGIAEDQIDG